MCLIWYQRTYVCHTRNSYSDITQYTVGYRKIWHKIFLILYIRIHACVHSVAFSLFVSLSMFPCSHQHSCLSPCTCPRPCSCPCSCPWTVTLIRKWRWTVKYSDSWHPESWAVAFFGLSACTLLWSRVKPFPRMCSCAFLDLKFFTWAFCFCSCAPYFLLLYFSALSFLRTHAPCTYLLSKGVDSQNWHDCRNRMVRKDFAMI